MIALTLKVKEILKMATTNGNIRGIWNLSSSNPSNSIWAYQQGGITGSPSMTSTGSNVTVSSISIGNVGFYHYRIRGTGNTSRNVSLPASGTYINGKGLAATPDLTLSVESGGTRIDSFSSTTSDDTTTYDDAKGWYFRIS